MQEGEASGTLDSKVNDLLGLDDADLKRVLSHNIDEVHSCPDPVHLPLSVFSYVFLYTRHNPVLDMEKVAGITWFCF